MFTYCEVGEREAPLDWKLRKEAIHHFLVGNPPRHPHLMKPMHWYKELKSAGVLTLGPLDIQHADYQKQLALKSMNMATPAQKKQQSKKRAMGTMMMKAAAASSNKSK